MADEANPGSVEAALSRSDDGPSDRSLLRDYRRGDQDAATLLYQRYSGRLLALARVKRSSDLAGRVDADDIVQSVFRSFFRGVILGSYDVPAGDEIWNLFLVIALNKIRAKGAHHRAAKRDVRQTTGAEGIEAAPLAIDSDGQAFALLKISIEEALEYLPKDQSQAIRLRMEGFEVAEIARAIGRSKRSVERLLQTSRDRLGELLID